MFINPAFAQAAAGAATAPSLSQTVFQLVAIAVIFYLLLIRPGQIKSKQEQAMRDAIVKGDKIITKGGIYAKVVKVEEKTLVVEIADNTKITIVKSSVIDILDADGKSKFEVVGKPVAVQKNLSKEQPTVAEKAKEVKEEVVKEEAPKDKKAPAKKTAKKASTKAKTAKKTASKAKKSDKLKEVLSK